MISEALWYKAEKNKISPLLLFLLTNHKAIIFSVVETLVYKIFYSLYRNYMHKENQFSLYLGFICTTP